MNIISSSKIISATLTGLLLASAPVYAFADGMIPEEKRTSAPPKQAKTAAPGKAVAPVFVYMMVPVEVANKEAAKSGCWARIYSGANYSGDTMTLTGPLAIADMSGPYGLDWDDKVDSVVVGPKATLTVYDNESFRDQVAVFGPGRSVPDISKPLGFFDEFASVKLTCAR
ncbi:peptidase inhibitor family I36 protein [Massilia sp. PAMC28688]|uniref:beta/gamma crystallin domain-containing protein n=1 Tax=Massilia sp. PAMC28688 TaxID=2861283 RepID=UPI001C6253AD|nr:beta/gamma crystallin domain-containing protein [Massilia sp. PAMC28688]QYF92360.1 peptidase inhibitor family I36 protein [Massilia sp. PAMC28688]